MKNKIQLFDDVMIGLLFVLFLCTLGWGAQINLAQGYTTSWTTANTNLNNYDTLNLGGPLTPDSTHTPPGSFEFTKKGILVRSYPNGYRQYISCYKTGGVRTITLSNDSIRMSHLAFIYTLGGTISGTNYCLGSVSTTNKWEAHQLDNIWFINENATTINLQGFITRVGHSTTIGMTVTNCWFKNIYNGLVYYTSPSEGKMSNQQNALVENCLFDASHFFAGEGWTHRNNMFIKSPGESRVLDSANNVTFENCYFHKTGGSEQLTWDYFNNALRATGSKIINCQFDSITHTISIDQHDGLIVRGCSFRSYGASNCVYFHDVTAPGINNLFERCFFSGENEYTIIHNNISANPMYDNIFRNNMFFGPPAVSLTGATTNTLDSSIFLQAPSNIVGFNVIDTVMKTKYSLVDTTMVHPFRKGNLSITYNRAGLGTLMNDLSVTDTTDSSFSVRCSLNVLFKHDNLIYDSLWTLNSIYGDTARLILKTGSTARDTVILKAGGVGTLTATGLEAGTEYDYTIYLEKTSSGVAVYDTTVQFSITTEGAASSSVIRTIINKIRVSLDIGP